MMASAVANGVKSKEMCSNQHLWRQFWNNVSWREMYYHVLDLMKKEKCLASRRWFLTCCRHLGLVPKTLEIKNKPHNSIADDLDKQWAQAVEKGEKDFLLIAENHVERELASARSVVRLSLIHI